jgi:hypothetical protein
MGSFSLNGSTYRTTEKGKLNGFVQLAIFTKLMPLLAAGAGELAPLITELRAKGFSGMASMPLEHLGQIITPVAREFAKMTEEDRRFIVGSCLAAVERKQDGKEGWHTVWNKEAQRAMFDDINDDLSVMLRITLFVLSETFAPFLPASLSNLLGEVLH